MKSNTIAMVLLFLFTGLRSLASWPEADTIILDGETIYIEKEVVHTNIDSLEEIGKEDITLKQMRSYPFSTGIYFGFNETVGTYSTSQSDLQPLDVFTGKPVSYKGNFTASADFSYRWWQFPGLGGNIELAAVSGIGYNKFRIRCSSLENASQLDADTTKDILGLRYAEGELLLDYFQYFTPPFGELDTAVVGIKTDVTQLTTFDVPLKLRAAWGKEKTGGRVFIEAGVVKRFVNKQNQDLYDNYVVNASANYMTLQKAEFKSISIIRPIFSIGAEKKVELNNGSKRNYLGFGCMVTATLPATSLNAGSLFVMNVKSFSGNIFARYYF